MKQSNLQQMVRIFLGGDVMLGRGIDAICLQSCSPELYEGYCTSALDYVHLAERHSGPLPRHCNPEYFWGNAIEVLNKIKPDVRVINLETSVTQRGTPDLHKGRATCLLKLLNLSCSPSLNSLLISYIYCRYSLPNASKESEHFDCFKY
jgi:poly-gamma-glutamate capsule biosynthesis protein CapA/YwtB (metallophosphatase superfamily)